MNNEPEKTYTSSDFKFFLSKVSPIQFSWQLPWTKVKSFIFSSLPLILIVYSTEIFHNISMSILALRFEKETLGYYSFAFRIFQVFLALFPALIREVMKTRLFYLAAQSQVTKEDSRNLVKMVQVYCFISLIFILVIYWWSDWIIFKVAPLYQSSAVTLKILSLALLPLGLTIIMGDYLCSPVFKKELFVISVWVTGILVQIILLLVNVDAQGIFWQVPCIYLLISIIVFLMIVGYSFKRRVNIGKCLARLFYTLLPWISLVLIGWVSRYCFSCQPSAQVTTNLKPFLLSFLFLIFVVSINNCLAKKVNFDEIFFK